MQNLGAGGLAVWGWARVQVFEFGDWREVWRFGGSGWGRKVYAYALRDWNKSPKFMFAAHFSTGSSCPINKCF